MERGMIKTGEAARMIGCSVATMRRNKQIPCTVSETGTRWYRRRDVEDYINQKPEVTLAYLRFRPGTRDTVVKAEENKAKAYCDDKRWKYEILVDFRSPSSFDTDEFIDLLERIMRRDICRLVTQSPQAIALIGHEIVLRLCEISSIDVDFLSTEDPIDTKDTLATINLLMNTQAGDMVSSKRLISDGRCD